jgi:carbonic anhydrase
MARMSSSEELLRQARNQGPSAPKKPRRKTAVIACMDTRVDPWKIVGAEVGDVHTIRNAGAIVTDDVVRSLIASTKMLAVDRVQIVMHTDCGMQGLTQQVVEEQLGPVPYDFGGFVSLEDELQRGVERLRSEPLIDAPKGITGHVYDIDTGELRLVVP